MSSDDMPTASVQTLDVVDPGSDLPGELVYEYAPRVTRVVEYGLPADSVLLRKIAPPAEGARLDLYLEGPVVAGRLKGTISGVDYLKFRADGRAEVHIHAEITTEGGEKVALEAGGVAIPQGDSPIYELREHVNLTSNHPELSWVNTLEVWARGVVDVSTGQVHLRAYAI